MRQRVWLIGGTGDSAKLAALLVQASISSIVTVTTEAARSLYPASPFLQIWVGRLSAALLPEFLQQQHVGAILDASHPFAIEVSQLAIAGAAQAKIPYLRFERPLVEPRSGSLILSSLEDLVAGEFLAGERVLLTIGYRGLPMFQSWQARSTLFARILPSTVALEAALAAGFTSDRLIALRPPLSRDLERSLWQHWQISLVVTKASGTPGGEDIKQQLAAELGVSLLTIARPTLNYSQQTSDWAIALEFCHLVRPGVREDCEAGFNKPQA